MRLFLLPPSDESRVSQKDDFAANKNLDVFIQPLKNQLLTLLSGFNFLHYSFFMPWMLQNTPRKALLVQIRIFFFISFFIKKSSTNVVGMVKWEIKAV